MVALIPIVIYTLVIYFTALLFRQFIKEFVAPTFKKRQNLKGKTAVVTGGTSGIGRELVKELYKAGCTIIFAGRSFKKAEQIFKDLKIELFSMDKSKGRISDDQKQITFYQIDQQDLLKVDAFSNFIESQFKKIDYLFNNTGGMNSKYKETPQGLESTIGVNHYSHVLLIHNLLPLITKTENFRVVLTASTMHVRDHWKLIFSPIDMFKVNKKEGYTIFSMLPVYSASKLAEVLFMRKLHASITSSSLIKPIKGKAFVVAPGVVDTDFTRVFTGIMGYLKKIGTPFFRNPVQGAQTLLLAAFEDYDNIQAGQNYAGNCVRPMDKLANDSECVESYFKFTVDCLEKALNRKLTNFTKEAGFGFTN